MNGVVGPGEGQVGVDRDLSKGVYWLERAVDKDDINAMRMLGTLYVTGPGMPVDMKKGIPLLERAASAGDRQAEQMLRLVQGVPR
jgi:TPR repeat protein